MKSHRIAAVVYRHCYEARRNLNRLTETLYWPVQNIFLWGFITIYLLHKSKGAAGFGEDLIAAAVLWGTFYAFQRDVALGFMEELWSRNLINLFSTPLSVWEYVTGLTVLSLLKAVIGFVLAALIAWLCYGYNVFPLIVPFLPFLFNLIFFALSISLAITGLMIRYSNKVNTLAWSVAGLLMPFSCVFYPVSTLPGWLRPMAWSLPTASSFEAMRQILAHGAFPGADFMLGLGFNFFYFALSVIFFRRMFAAAQSKGFLVKQL
jgi:ABC-2 type transport system permease protein